MEKLLSLIFIAIIAFGFIVNVKIIIEQIISSKSSGCVTKIKTPEIDAELDSSTTLARAYISYYSYMLPYFRAIFKNDEKKVGLASYLYMFHYPVNREVLEDIVCMVNSEFENIPTKPLKVKLEKAD
jgi:hypothetical protein